MTKTSRRVLPVAVVLALAGCGGDGDSPDDGGDTSSSEETRADDAVGGEGSPEDGDGPASAGNGAGDGGADVQASVEVRGGRVRGGVARVEAGVGDLVELAVTSDVADHVHVHGYDLEAPVGPGEPATVTFRADIPGVFEVELEDRGLEVAELTVGG